MANRRNLQFTYSFHNKLTLLDCNFVVDNSNGNGLGIRSLKGAGIANVFMHTTATPASGNPNPPAGYILVQLQDNYQRYFGGAAGFVAAPGSTTATIVAHNVYVIASLGTTTAAQWLTSGVPASAIPVGVSSTKLPAVGTAFVAATGETIPGSPLVYPIAATGSGVDHIEVVGDANQTIISSGAGGGYLLLACFSGGSVTAPANNSVIGLSFQFNNTAAGI